MNAICVLFLLCPQLRLSFVSVLFDFNASLIDIVPVTPMKLPVDSMRIKKSGLLMNAICVLFLLSSPPKSSVVSVVFDFNASLNDAAPVSPIPLPVVVVVVVVVQCKHVKQLCF